MTATALVASLGSARADVNPYAAPIVEHYIKATGDSALRAAEISLHLRGRIEADGMTGHWEQWTQAPDRWMRRFTLGPLKFREGYDGRVAWRTDLTDKGVHEESAADARHAQEEGWFLNERWALPGADGGSVAPGEKSYGVQHTADEVIVTPPSGHPRRLFFDSKTGYLERVIYESDDGPVEDHPGTYKTIGGRKRATIYAAPTLLPTDKPVERLTVDSVKVNPSLDSAFFAPPVVTERAITWQNSKKTIRVPFSYGSKAVMVMVSVNGAEPVEFILDTGASLSLLDHDYAYSIGLHPEGDAGVNGIAESGNIRFARVHSLALAGRKQSQVALRDFRVALLDLAEDGEIVLWKKPMGILGADFLRQFVVEIDYDSQIVSLYDPATFVYSGHGAPIPFELNGGCPIVDASVDGTCPGKFLIDVGNSFHFTIHRSLVQPCHLIGSKRRHEVEVAGGGIGGGFVSTLCRLDSVNIGPYSWPEPVAALALHTRGGIGSKDIGGNIGNSVLERFKCTFDYARQILYLEPGRRYVERDRVSRFGALFARLGSNVIAGNVLTGSAAYEAGLRWYDEIISIDGKPLEKWTREEVDRVLEEGVVGSEHTVVYRRFDFDPPTTVTVTLKDVL
ncbi:MAG TPA: aspartyl protease family protein [Candidatus Udaeobacter sp.]|nr:aspartyl protease family protein [Candidatus Udaeobacter sp.]